MMIYQFYFPLKYYINKFKYFDISHIIMNTFSQQFYSSCFNRFAARKRKYSTRVIDLQCVISWQIPLHSRQSQKAPHINFSSAILDPYIVVYMAPQPQCHTLRYIELISHFVSFRGNNTEASNPYLARTPKTHMTAFNGYSHTRTPPYISSYIVVYTFQHRIYNAFEMFLPEIFLQLRS